MYGTKGSSTLGVSKLVARGCEDFTDQLVVSGLEIILCRGDKRKSGNENDIEFLAPDRMSFPSSSSTSSGSSRSLRRGCCNKRRSRYEGEAVDGEEEKTYRLVVVSL